MEKKGGKSACKSQLIEWKLNRKEQWAMCVGEQLCHWERTRVSQHVHHTHTEENTLNPRSPSLLLVSLKHRYLHWITRRSWGNDTYPLQYLHWSCVRVCALCLGVEIFVTGSDCGIRCRPSMQQLTMSPTWPAEGNTLIHLTSQHKSPIYFQYNRIQVIPKMLRAFMKNCSRINEEIQCCCAYYVQSWNHDTLSVRWTTSGKVPISRCLQQINK